MVNDFHLNENVAEMVPEEQRCHGPVDDELWGLALDDFVGWLVRAN